MRQFVFLSLVLFTVQLHAQKSEVGLFGGVTGYTGDMTDNWASSMFEMKFASGAYYRYSYNRYFSARAGFVAGSLSGSDGISELDYRRERNLSFRSPILEVNLLPEFNIVELPVGTAGSLVVPYVSVGVAGFYFNPQAQLDGVWYDLQPLGTEGQFLPNSTVAPYKRTVVAIPMVMGVKFFFNEYGSVTLESGTRKTFTDYLDDVGGTYPDIAVLTAADPVAGALADRSPEYFGVPVERTPGTQRGGKYKDWYFFSGLSVALTLAQNEDAITKPKKPAVKKPQ